MIEIVTLGEEILWEKAKPIERFGSEISLLANEMLETMLGDNGIGLAGPQIGVDKRIFVVQLQGDQPRVFINPEIIETSIETVTYEEGCLSVPGVFADLDRPESVTVQARDVAGKPFTLKADGMLARVIQHENDHLNGVLFVDRLPPTERERILQVYEKKEHKRKKRRV
ncbi:MAG: peptide deformylase [Spirochaetota bacterium]